MYTTLANILFIIHIIVIIFMISGIILPEKWKRIKIFHSYFCIITFIFQVICGLKCPLTILEEYLRKLGNPNYVITSTPFTEKIFMNLFGISISSNVIFLVIGLLAVVGIAYLLTEAKIKRMER